jgi:hypothetical protein
MRESKVLRLLVCPTRWCLALVYWRSVPELKDITLLVLAWILGTYRWCLVSIRESGIDKLLVLAWLANDNTFLHEVIPCVVVHRAAKQKARNEHTPLTG